MIEGLSSATLHQRFMMKRELPQMLKQLWVFSRQLICCMFYSGKILGKVALE